MQIVRREVRRGRLKTLLYGAAAKCEVRKGDGWMWRGYRKIGVKLSGVE